MSLRIIAGERRGAMLTTPQGDATRPTLGRVRESLFMILMPELADARVLDCFAGCGALGFEALSRGAAHVTLIEQARPALDAIQANIAKLRWQDRVRVMALDVLTWLRAPKPPGGLPFDIIFLDPPYGLGLCHQALEQLGKNAEGWLAPGGVIAAQYGRRDEIQESYGPLIQSRMKDYSQTRIAFFNQATPL